MQYVSYLYFSLLFISLIALASELYLLIANNYNVIDMRGTLISVQNYCHIFVSIRNSMSFECHKTSLILSRDLKPTINISMFAIQPYSM